MKILCNKDKVKEIKIEYKPDNPADLQWFDGYKGMDQNMICTYNGNTQQYEVGETFKYDGDVELCKSGFHFCTNLRDVFNFYCLDNKNRYFKVRGLVDVDAEKQAEEEEKQRRYAAGQFYTGRTSTKRVASEIEILEELTFDKLKTYIQQEYPWIETEEEWKSITDYPAFCIQKFTKLMQEACFSPIFIALMLESTDVSGLKYLYTFSAALKEQGISNDMLVYLIVRQFQK